MTVYRESGAYWFKNRAGDLDYGPYLTRQLANHDLRRYRTYLKFQTKPQK